MEYSEPANAGAAPDEINSMNKKNKTVNTNLEYYLYQLKKFLNFDDNYFIGGDQNHDEGSNENIFRFKVPKNKYPNADELKNNMHKYVFTKDSHGIGGNAGGSTYKSFIDIEDNGDSWLINVRERNVLDI